MRLLFLSYYFRLQKKACPVLPGRLWFYMECGDWSPLFVHCRSKSALAAITPNSNAKLRQIAALQILELIAERELHFAVAAFAGDFTEVDVTRIGTRAIPV